MRSSGAPAKSAARASCSVVSLSAGAGNVPCSVAGATASIGYFGPAGADGSFEVCAGVGAAAGADAGSGECMPRHTK